MLVTWKFIAAHRFKITMCFYQIAGKFIHALLLMLIGASVKRVWTFENQIHSKGAECFFNFQWAQILGQKTYFERSKFWLYFSNSPTLNIGKYALIDELTPINIFCN